MKRKIKIVILAVFFLISTNVVAHAGATSFLFGLETGFLLSPGQAATAKGISSEEYLSANISRVVNPLAVRTIMARVNLLGEDAGKTFWQLFAETETRNPKKFEILRIKIMGVEGRETIIIFSYIERDQLK